MRHRPSPRVAAFAELAVAMSGAGMALGATGARVVATGAVLERMRLGTAEQQGIVLQHLKVLLFGV